MKPRRPTVKDSTQNIRSEGAKRKAQQVAAKAARKAAAKKSKLASESVASREDLDQAALGVVHALTKDK